MATKGIWMPIEVLQDKELTMQEKLILMEINQLVTLDKNSCFASNEHFAEMLNVSKKSVSNTISSLAKKGKIDIEIEERNRKRTISIKDGGVSIKDGGVSIKDGGVSIKDGESKDKKTFKKTIKKKNNTKKSFSFSLSKKQSYDNLSAEYKQKLKAKCLLIDGSISRYEDFVTQLEAKGYQYKDFSKAYIAWDHEKAYKDFAPEPEPKLGDGWYRIRIGSNKIIAVNEFTLEIKEGEVTVKQVDTQERSQPIQTGSRDVLSVVGGSIRRMQ